MKVSDLRQECEEERRACPLLALYRTEAVERQTFILAEIGGFRGGLSQEEAREQATAGTPPNLSGLGKRYF